MQHMSGVGNLPKSTVAIDVPARLSRLIGRRHSTVTVIERSDQAHPAGVVLIEENRQHCLEAPFTRVNSQLPVENHRGIVAQILDHAVIKGQAACKLRSEPARGNGAEQQYRQRWM
jgi:hypothetical protein